MFGWCLLFMLVIIVLGRRAWKKYALKLAELNSRLSQVEELLLEVCSLVEEESGEEMLLPVVETAQLPAAELPKADSEQLAQAELLPPAALPSDQGTKHPKGKKGGSVNPQKLPEWHQQIIELYEKGLSVQEIARQIEKGQGEVQLVVDLYLQ
ncbi:MAG TPA: hypothetical protein DD789_07820 [Firmicutes bacterium]|jgi:hypothetical protein|nr:hypothetical protein [Bacillota bacterium]